MYVVEKTNNDRYKTLIHSENIFHDALNGGEKRYHVKDADNGDYDLVYIENETLNPIIPAFKNIKRIPDYLAYNESETESLILNLFGQYDTLSCEEVNEYTVVLAKVLIKELGYTVYFTDKAVLRFIKSEPQSFVTGKRPTLNQALCEATESANGAKVGASRVNRQLLMMLHPPKGSP